MSDNLNARPHLTEGQQNQENNGQDAPAADTPGGAPSGEQNVELPDIPAQAPYAARG